MLTEYEKTVRRTRIGSSDIALIALGPQFVNQSLWELYHDKIGSPLPPHENDYMTTGSFLEEGISKIFSYRTGLIIAKGMHTKHPTESWMGCSPDYTAWSGLPLTDAGQPHCHLLGPVECKNYTSREDWGGHDEPEAVPPAILCQVQWQLACLEADLGWVAALVCGEYRHYPCPRSEALIRRLMELGREFWFECVLAKKPPEPDWSIKRTGEIWQALNPIVRDEVQLPDAALSWADQYLDANEAIAHLEKDKIIAKNHLLTFLGDAKRGILCDGRTVRRGKQFGVSKRKDKHNVSNLDEDAGRDPVRARDPGQE